jgi:hypothetical protein
MLSINSYPRAYVDDCRRKLDQQLAAYAGLPRDPAFERPFFRRLLLALDHYFDHRSRSLEDKDGNPLNELRVLCSAIMHSDGRLAADKQIRLDPTNSVLGLKLGDEIDLDAKAFARLAAAVCAEIEAKYP